jgi:catechol-2,3-dioxygenase
LIDWYTDTLGFEASTDNDGRYFLGLADGSYLRIIEAEDKRQSSHEKESGLHHIAFTVDDFDDLVEKIKQQNLEILMEPKTTEDGRRLFSFRDIEGNFLQFVYYMES